MYGTCSPHTCARQAGAQVLLVINASPYEVDKQTQREQEIVRARIAETGIPLVFVNLIGGQDELVFDGNSFVMDAKGAVTHARAGVYRRPVRGGSRDGLLGRGQAGARRDRAAAGRGRKRLRGAGAGHARLRGQTSFSRRGAGLVRRRGLGADLGVGGGRAGRGSGALGVDALALHLADEQGRCGAAGEVARRQAQRDFHRRHVRSDAGRPQG